MPKKIATIILCSSALFPSLSAAETPLSSYCPSLKEATIYPDVKSKCALALQKVLNIREGAQINETGRFDAATQKALKNFQDKFRSDILTPAGLTHATGLYGGATRKKIYEVCLGQSDDSPRETEKPTVPNLTASNTDPVQFSAPTIKLIWPKSMTTATSGVSMVLVALADSDRTLSSVGLYVNGTPSGEFARFDHSPVYIATWTPGQTQSGDNALQVLVRDSGGNIGKSDRIDISVNKNIVPAKSGGNSGSDGGNSGGSTSDPTPPHSLTFSPLPTLPPLPTFPPHAATPTSPVLPSHPVIPAPSVPNSSQVNFSDVAYGGASTVHPFIATEPYNLLIGGVKTPYNLYGASRGNDFSGNVPFINPTTRVADAAQLQGWDRKTNSTVNLNSGKMTEAGLPGVVDHENGYTVVRYRAGDGMTEGKARSQLNGYAIPPRTYVKWVFDVAFGGKGDDTWDLLPPGKNPVLIWQTKSTSGTNPSLSADVDTDDKDPKSLMLTFLIRAGNAPYPIPVGEIRGLKTNTLQHIEIEGFLDERDAAKGGKGKMKFTVNGSVVATTTMPNLTRGPAWHNWSLCAYLWNQPARFSHTRAIFWKTAKFFVYPARP